MKIRHALLYYFGCILAICLMLFFSVLFKKIELFWGSIPLYLVCGLFLGKFVLNKLIEFHPVHRTIDNIVATKISNMIFWLFSYPILFLKLAVVKYL